MTSTSRIARTAPIIAASLALCWGVALARQGTGQQPAATVPGAAGTARAAETLQSIDDDYNRQILQIERQRLQRLARLAAHQDPKDAAETYELLFRMAIANNLFADADPIADQVVKTANTPSPVVLFLAETVNIIAGADRGAYDESLADLRRLIGAGARTAQGTPAPPTVLDTPSLLAICGAYYQRLAQGERFDVARKAFQLISQESNNPDVKEFCAHRLNQINLIGKPAPPIRGTDVDNKPFDLAGLKGDVVLVVFWASWCLPNAAEVAWLDSVYEANRNRGLRIVGINLDTLQNNSQGKLEIVMPNIRRFLLDHNVRWPNVVNGQGAQDYAAAYGVTEIPSNVLIGRNGNVISLDLSRKNLSQAVARAVAAR